jgi:hypothetical protein
MPNPTSAPSPFVTTAAIARAAVVTLAVLASACASTDHAMPGPPPETRSTDTDVPIATTTPDDNTAILAAYQEFWQVWLRANNPPNPDYPDLVNVATGQELITVRQAISQDLGNGNYTRLPANASYRHDASIVSNLDGHALVTDCAVDDSEIRNRDSDQIVNGAAITQLLQSDLAQTAGRWRVSNVQKEQQWSGIRSCL